MNRYTVNFFLWLRRGEQCPICTFHPRFSHFKTVNKNSCFFSHVFMSETYLNYCLRSTIKFTLKINAFYASF